jgi:hypothetical protein
MAFVTIEYCAAVEIRLTFDTVWCALTLGFDRGAPIAPTVLQNLVDGLAEWWYTYARPLTSSLTVLREVYARDLTFYGAKTAVSYNHAGSAGTLTTGPVFPANCAFSVSFRTALRGRANRGRNYWLGFGDYQRSGPSELSTTYVNQLIGLYERLLPGGSNDPTPFIWSVLSRQLDGVPGGRAIPITAVIAVDNYIDSQRRRLPGRGS